MHRQGAAGLAAWTLLAGMAVSCGDRPSDEDDTASADDTGSVDWCDLDGTGPFSSVEELECGLAPEGEEALCHWTVSLLSSMEFVWDHSDVTESGTWVCAGSEVSADLANGDIIDASYNASTGVLTWDGVDYEQ
jgi:hypothetical protein